MISVKGLDCSDSENAIAEFSGITRKSLAKSLSYIEM